jgi:hypothetical protein
LLDVEEFPLAGSDHPTRFGVVALGRDIEYASTSVGLIIIHVFNLEPVLNL